RTELLDVGDRSLEVRHGLDMHRDHAGTGGNELFDVVVRLFDHEMHVERPSGDALDGADDRRADRDIWDEVPVHHVDVNQIGAAAFRGGNVTTEGREIGRQDRRRDLYGCWLRRAHVALLIGSPRW